MLTCPICKNRLATAQEETGPACSACGRVFSQVMGIPVLLSDPAQVDNWIASAKSSGRSSWYEDDQDIQLTGHYRHHFHKRRIYIDSVIRQYFPDSSGKVGLDLGCGDGMNLSLLREHVQTLYACDYNNDRIFRAKKRCPSAKFFIADIGHLPMEDASFDLILFNHVLEHIPEDLDALREVRRILKDDGKVILGIPNEGALFWQVAYLLQPNVKKNTDHVHFYTAQKIQEKCDAAGLKVLMTHSMGWGVPHWAFDARLRQFKVIDDLFEKVGSQLFPQQASSLYLILQPAS